MTSRARLMTRPLTTRECEARRDMREERAERERERAERNRATERAALLEDYYAAFCDADRDDISF